MDTLAYSLLPFVIPLSPYHMYDQLLSSFEFCPIYTAYEVHTCMAADLSYSCLFLIQFVPVAEVLVFSNIRGPPSCCVLSAGKWYDNTTVQQCAPRNGSLLPAACSLAVPNFEFCSNFVKCSYHRSSVVCR